MIERLRDLLERINQLSTQGKLFTLLAIFLVLSVGYWYMFWTPKVEQLRELELQIQKKEKLLNEYRLIAKELPEFKRQYKLLTREFEAASRKLPTDKEIPGLIDSIYGAVNESGLTSNTFIPRKEIRKGIYAEIPVEMNVSGTYYNLAKFFDRVSRLSRIVNINDLNLKRAKRASDGSMLEASFTAVTFRILPHQETEPAKGKAGARKRRHR